MFKHVRGCVFSSWARRNGQDEVGKMKWARRSGQDVVGKNVVGEIRREVRDGQE